MVHLAGTGDHGFERRLRLAGPLLEKVSHHHSTKVSFVLRPDSKGLNTATTVLPHARSNTANVAIHLGGEA